MDFGNRQNRPFPCKYIEGTIVASTVRKIKKYNALVVVMGT